jgi:1,4-alpha-glucan branching enzyme
MKQQPSANEAALSIVLHCHLPWVCHPEGDGFLEEDWLHEAVAETYVPLLLMLDQLAADRVPCRLNMSVSPTLCEMLRSDLLRARTLRYLERNAALACSEVQCHAGKVHGTAARMYAAHYERVLTAYTGRYGGDLVAAFGAAAARGQIVLLGSTATHALLPLLGSDACRRAQVDVGLANFAKHFGYAPDGFWLPECAWRSDLDALMDERGIRYTVVDTHGVLLAAPRPPLGVFAPLSTPAGLAVFGRDVESSHQVWSAAEGYPGDAVYREFHRDLGYDGDLDYLRSWLPPDGARRPLGIKYHRVTDRNDPRVPKQPYDPARAAARVAEHAEHFVRSRVEQSERIAAATGRAPVITAPYDAELFGHWWWEGPAFLEHVIRRVAAQPALRLASARDCIAPQPLQTGMPAESTWGDGGYYDVWVNDATDWIYPMLHDAERRLADVSDGEARTAALRQLLLAEAGDWPFLIRTGSARAYAERRFREHMAAFERCLSGEPPAPCPHDPFPELDGCAFG